MNKKVKNIWLFILVLLDLIFLIVLYLMYITSTLYDFIMGIFLFIGAAFMSWKIFKILVKEEEE